MKKQQKTISKAERIEGLLNIAANNKMRGSKYIKPSLSALGNLFAAKSKEFQIKAGVNPQWYSYN
jgi:hypothetical protein